MNSFKEYIRKHLPETICVCVTVVVFVVMSVYAIILYCKMISNDENTFEQIQTPVQLTEMSSENMDDPIDNKEYYMVGNGKKYHTSDCYYVSSGSDVTSILKEEIEQYGLEPCSKCIK